MPWIKGQSGNPAGGKKGSRKQSTDVAALIKRGSRNGLKLLCDIIDGKIDGDKQKAATYMIDRDLGKPETAESTAGGMFQGASITVHTGFSDAPRAIEAPTIDMPVNGAVPTHDDDADTGIE